MNAPEPRSGASRASARALAWGFVGLVLLTSGLIVLGALVRAHEAGLACPDWPLCFGEVVPEFDLQVAFEWSHRAVAGSVSLIFTGLAIAVLRQPALAPRMRGLLVLGFVLLGVQVLLGALTVWQLLAAWTVTSHLVVGNSFNLCLLCIALELRRAGLPPAPARPDEASLRVGLAAVAVLLLLQIVLGGLVSSTFSGMACPEWPACNGGVWFPGFRGSVGLHLAHRWNAYLLGIAFAAWLVASLRVPSLRALAALGATLVLAQIVVGIANVLLGIPVEVTGLHSALAAALVLWTGGTLWRLQRAASPANW